MLLIFVTGCASNKMTNNNADQANHKDANKEKGKKHDSGEISYFFELFLHVSKSSRNKLKKHSVTKSCCCTVGINFSSDLKNFANSEPSALNFKKNSRSLEQFFSTIGKNSFGHKIQFLYS